MTGPRLFRCLKSVLATPEVSEVIVRNNGNPDEVMRKLLEMAQHETRLQVLSSGGNIGFAAGCNLGVKAARGDMILLLNPDAVLPEGGVGKLLLGYHAASGAGGEVLIGGRLVDEEGVEQAGSRRRELTPHSALIEFLALYRLRKGLKRFNLHQEKLPDQTIPVPTISGACMLLSKAGYDAIDGMDEGYFLHVEDVDFCRRFHRNGGQILFCPHVDILHEGGSSDIKKRKVEKYKAQSLIRYFRTHFRGDYPPGTQTLLSVAIWSGYAARVIRLWLSKL